MCIYKRNSSFQCPTATLNNAVCKLCTGHAATKSSSSITICYICDQLQSKLSCITYLKGKIYWETSEFNGLRLCILSLKQSLDITTTHSIKRHKTLLGIKVFYSLKVQGVHQGQSQLRQVRQMSPMKIF